MRHVLKILIACIIILPAMVLAQTNDDETLVEQEKQALFANLMYEDGRGFVASEMILSRSSASYLNQNTTPLTVEELSALPVAYDPLSGSGASTGMLYFHLAYPVALLRELGGVPNEILSRIIENRLRWLADDTDRAFNVAVQLVGQLEDIGVEDVRMTSLLADAAVLSWRAGQVEMAEKFLERARSCSQLRCPQDLVFEWLGQNRRPHKTRMDGYDIDLQRNQALADAEIIWPGNTRIKQDIQTESLLMSDNARNAVTDVLNQMQMTENANDLTRNQRRQSAHLATRLMGVYGIEEMLMSAGSVASNIGELRDANGELVTENLDSLSYMNPQGRFSGFLLRGMPLIHDLLQVSDRRGDDVVADAIVARLMLAIVDYPRASRALQKLVNESRARGFTDAELHSVLMDLWLAASLSGDTETAAQADRDTLACRQQGCSADLVAAFFKRAEDLPKIQHPAGLKELQIGVADPFLRNTFPGDMLVLADLYETGVGGSQNKPMDGARYDALSIRFAEQAPEITASELQKRAANAMDTMIYAGQYSSAAALGDRIIARLTEAGDADELSIRFYQIRARAAFRLGDSNARLFYTTAVDLASNSSAAATDVQAIPEDLSLDLQDTPYLELLDKMATFSRVNSGVLARLRYRQGRYLEAADVMQSYRRSAELYGFDLVDHLIAMIEAQKNTHLRSRNLDAYVAAQLWQQKVLDQGDVPIDHPLFYSISDAMKAIAEQEAVYRIAAGDPERARQLRALGGPSDWSDPWQPLDEAHDADAIAAWENRSFKSTDTYRQISRIIDFRDNGNYEAAAVWMRQYRWVAVVAEANGEYIDAQTLWQMAFTYARVGEADIAFDLMNRAARIAATLSFEGAGGADGGTLQLLERDRWRYLLFVDIAWAAVSGQTPEEMLVVSRY